MLSRVVVCNAAGIFSFFIRITENLQAQITRQYVAEFGFIGLILACPPWRVIRGLFLGFLQQFHQLIFPQAGDGVAAVAARFVAHWNHDGATVRNAFDLAFENTELGRVD